MRNRYRIILLTVLFFAIVSAPASAGLLYGPYLQSLSPDKMEICAGVDPSDRLTVRLDDGKTTAEKQAAGAKPACAEFANLAPDVEYRYTVLLNGERAGDGPPPAFVASTTGVLTFAVFGDTRSGDDSFDLTHRSIVEAIRTSVVPDGILHTGDFVERGRDEALWTNFFRIEAGLLAGAPIFPAIGQSDQPDDLIRKIFPVLGASPFYSFDRERAHFVVLDLWLSSSQPASEVSPDSTQARWLREDLARARSSGAKYIFVLLHEPVVGADGTVPPALRETFMPIFEAFHVTAVFSGAHYFSHALKNGVHYFTNGGGGAALETPKAAEGAFLFFQAVHHFLVLEIDPSGARVKAMNEGGAAFYTAALDASAAGAVRDASPVFVETYHGGARSVPATVFFLEGCGDCDRLKTELPEIARRTQTTLVVTFRSLSDAQNRALLGSLTDKNAPTPVVALGDEVLAGIDQIEPMIEQAVRAAALPEKPKEDGVYRWIAAGAAALAGLLLLAAIAAMWKKKAAPRT